MLKIDNFISFENDIFYVDLLSYNEQTDVKFEDTDIIRFKHDGSKYIGMITNMGNGQDGIFKLIDVKKTS